VRSLEREEAVLIRMREGVKRSEAEVGEAIALLITSEDRGDSITTILISFYVACCTIVPSS
jgi:hypothetical protein